MSKNNIPIDHLPKTTARDVFGNKIKLSEIDSEYVLLVFLRYAGCPWCNLAIHRLTQEYEELSANKCKIVAFVQSDTDSVKKNIYDRHHPQPPFPIIADSKQNFYKLYGVKPSLRGTAKSLLKIPYWLKSTRELGYAQTKVDGNLFMVPGWFLYSNRTNKIVKSQEGISLYDHEAFLQIYESLYFKD